MILVNNLQKLKYLKKKKMINLNNMTLPDLWLNFCRKRGSIKLRVLNPIFKNSQILYFLEIAKT